MNGLDGMVNPKQKVYMKVTDYETVRGACADELMENGCDLVEFIGVENTILTMFNIYMTNNLTTGFGQDFRVTENAIMEGDEMHVSVISSPTRISILIDRNMSYYKQDEGLCGYEDLSDDIANIRIVIDAVIARIQAAQ